MVALVIGACGKGSTDVPSEWTLVWSDDFDGAANTGVDAAKWLYDLGTSYPGGAPNWGTGEIESMTNSVANVSLDGAGHLRITPVRDASGKWTSGRIETQRNDFEPPKNGILRVEASIQQPDVTPTNGLGYWPAFWLLGGPFRGSYTNWPSVGEIDVLENVNARPSVFSTFHCGNGIPGTCNETTGIGSGERPCVGCLTGFHTYSMEWDRSVSPQQLRWYLDGNNYFTLKQDNVDAASWTTATSHGYMIILNVAIGGGFPGAFGGGPTAATVSGVPMVVDYVRVYQR
jgi:beta-glucanase (GH16 family)